MTQIRMPDRHPGQNYKNLLTRHMEFFMNGHSCKFRDTGLTAGKTQARKASIWRFFYCMSSQFFGQHGGGLTACRFSEYRSVNPHAALFCLLTGQSGRNLKTQRGITMTNHAPPRTRGMIKTAAFTAAEINQTTIQGYWITPAEAQAMLEILTKHDGSTLTPERDHQARAVVSRMFDKLRFNLGGIAQREKEAVS